MEEILASIKRIIADDEPPKAAAAPVPAPEPEPMPALAVAPEPDPEPLTISQDEDVLDLAMAQVEAEVVAEAQPPAEDAFADVAFAEAEPPAPEPVVAPIPVPIPVPRVEAPPRREAFVAPQPASTPPEPPRFDPPPPRQDFAAQASPESLLSGQAREHVAAQFGALTHAVFPHAPKTMEDITKELLRPMLQQWLDDNLPVLVERLVREEIERVSRGRR